jgi:hypothetical protein
MCVDRKRAIRARKAAVLADFILITVLILLASPSRALAYVDPNAGGFIFQIVTPIAVIGAVALAFLKRQWLALLAWVFRRDGAGIGRVLEGSPDTREP